MVESKICRNCGEEFTPSKSDKRIVFCCSECRIEYRNKTGYMNEYYHANLKSWKDRQSSEAYKEAKNKSRRLRYATDEEYREKRKADTKLYYKDNPDRKIEQRLKKFNITLDDYKSLLEQQHGKCAICGSTVGDEMGNRLYVDHNHSTGKVRGLLCSSCNFGIGKFKDSPTLLRNAIRYLEETDGTDTDMV